MICILLQVQIQMVGKSFISALLTYKLKATYFKPIQAGDLNKGGDTAFVKKITNLPDTHFLEPSYSLKASLSPHEAASQENIEIKSTEIYERIEKISQQNMIIEGAGGIYVPINRNEYILDLIQKINAPTIIVARSTLGTINHTLLTVRTLENFGVPIKGIILNGETSGHNKKAIAYYSKLPIIGEIPLCPNMQQLNIDDYAKMITL